jgi:hypothetical protein
MIQAIVEVTVGKSGPRLSRSPSVVPPSGLPNSDRTASSAGVIYASDKDCFTPVHRRSLYILPALKVRTHRHKTSGPGGERSSWQCGNRIPVVMTIASHLTN